MGFSPLRPLCLLGVHRPSKADIKPAGTDYVTVCARCGRGLIKKRFSNKWVQMKARESKARRKRR
jgi:hypothetical protein